MQTEQLDVLIIGAGLSGIGMAQKLLQERPNDTFAVIESRADIGGTWSYFKYPGLRSDSDMYTFAYSFKPWRHREYIGSSTRIMNYLNEVVDDYHVREHIRFNTRVIEATWDSMTKRWTALLKNSDGEQTTVEAKFLVSCTGYYNYDHGYEPAFENQAAFKGDIIHPQKWPENYDYSNKKVVVIGSGATAFTVVPEMAKKAQHVTMVQRSPSYVYNRPASDALFRFLNRFLPAKVTNKIMRIKYVCLQQFSYGISKRFPAFTKKMLINDIRKAAENKVDVDTHFTPNYQPWDQRVCMVPDNDLFESIKAGKSSVVTDSIKQFTEDGVQMHSGQVIPADLIVTATGLDVQVWGGMKVSVDGYPVHPNDLTNYKGLMFSQMPNMVTIFGYTNTSWTVKAELSYDYVTRLLNLMQRKGFKTVYPHLKDGMTAEGIVGLNSGYIIRAIDRLPKQGDGFPWCNKDFYFADLLAIKHSTLEDGILTFDDTRALDAFHQKANKAREQKSDPNPDAA